MDRARTLPSVYTEGNVLARSIQRYNITADQTAVAPVKRFTKDKKQEELSVQDLRAARGIDGLDIKEAPDQKREHGQKRRDADEAAPQDSLRLSRLGIVIPFGVAPIAGTLLAGVARPILRRIH